MRTEVVSRLGSGEDEGPILRRRDFLRSCAALGLAACSGFPAEGNPVAPDELAQLDALGQAAHIRSGQISARELALATIDRIERLDPPINAVVTRFFDRALAEIEAGAPTGRFGGVPFLLKDLNELEGTRTTRGSRLFAENISDHSSAHTEATLAAGFVVLGKTNTPEFGLVATTESAMLGPCRNPWNLEYSTGGSSGGSAAAVAAGILPMAQASDGGGSIRIPASCCGVFGLKPSRGRNPSDGPGRAVDISVKHCVSRSVRDSAAFLAATERKDSDAPLPATGLIEGPSGRRLRVAFHTLNAYGVNADAEVRSAVEATATLCAELGHRVEQAQPDYRGDEFREHFLNLWTSGPEALLRDLESRGVDPTQVLEPVTIGMALRYRSQPDGAMSRAVTFFNDYASHMDRFFQEYDVILSPVLRTPPVRLGTQGGTLPFEQVFDAMLDYVSYTPVFNATGSPAMSVPLSWSSAGLPIGSHFAARLGGEATLLELAYELEAARPWANRWAPASIGGEERGRSFSGEVVPRGSKLPA